MTKQEIKEAIENGESVWCVYKDQSNIYEIKAVEIEKVLSNTFLWGKEYYSNIKDVFKTKAEAEHHLNHANVTRTETLPFLTWEEFKEEKDLFFTNRSGYPMCLCVVDTKLGKKIGLGGANGYFDLQQTWDLTEENFYKAYDECVRLFKGGEQL